MKKARWLYLVVALALIGVSSAKADIIGPGGNVTGPGQAFNIGSYTDVAYTGDNPPLFNNANGYALANIFTNDAGHGLWGEIVISDPNNVFCAGCFDFLIQVSVETGDIGRVTTSDFSGFQTSVGYWSGYWLTSLVQNGYPPEVNATSIERSSDGGIIGFSFSPGDVTTGKATYLMVIETNATNYKPGALQFINGGVAYEQGFAPAVPDGGMTLMLLGSALVGLGTLRRRFRA
jgi:hypothetical protein